MLASALGVLFKGRNLARLLGGLWVTLRLSAVSILLSVALGLALGMVMTLRSPIIRALTRLWLETIRIVPQLVLLFVVRGALHRPAHVVLPQDASSSDVSDASLDDSAVGRIAVRPDTVQSAIATLERPARYSRAITIERYYSGGSGVDRSSVSVDGAWMRVDTEQASGAQSHTISNGERTWVWYGGSELYYESAAAFTADEEQGIPTYEDILRLDKKRIAAADYRLLDTVDCIFVETAADDGGYIERYWVSVSNGLLCAAEKLQGEDVVYRMAGMSVDSGNVAEDAFTLPDGTVLHEGALDGANR